MIIWNLDGLNIEFSICDICLKAFFVVFFINGNGYPLRADVEMIIYIIVTSGIGHSTFVKKKGHFFIFPPPRTKPRKPHTFCHRQQISSSMSSFSA